jgi:hypothetical protein
MTFLCRIKYLAQKNRTECPISPFIFNSNPSQAISLRHWLYGSPSFVQKNIKTEHKCSVLFDFFVEIKRLASFRPNIMFGFEPTA